MAFEICSRLAAGQTLREICRDEKLPDKATVHRWIVEDRGGFRDQYARAREAQADDWADEIIEIADDATNDWVERTRKDGSTFVEADREHIARSAQRIDARKWLMARTAPKKWGDKTQLEVGGSGGGPMQVVIRRMTVDGEG